MPCGCVMLHPVQTVCPAWSRVPLPGSLPDSRLMSGIWERNGNRYPGAGRHNGRLKGKKWSRFWCASHRGYRVRGERAGWLPEERCRTRGVFLPWDGSRGVLLPVLRSGSYRTGQTEWVRPGRPAAPRGQPGQPGHAGRYIKGNRIIQVCFFGLFFSCTRQSAKRPYHGRERRWE